MATLLFKKILKNSPLRSENHTKKEGGVKRRGFFKSNALYTCVYLYNTGIQYILYIQNRMAQIAHTVGHLCAWSLISQFASTLQFSNKCLWSSNNYILYYAITNFYFLFLYITCSMSPQRCLRVNLVVSPQ